MSISSRFRSALAPLAIAASCALPASAEPGQSVAAFTAWSGQKIVLRGLEKTTEETSGRPAYRLTNSDRGIAWSFDAIVIGGSIGSESLTVGSNGTATGDPIRHDGTGYGFTFWKALYGPAVATDFRASRVVFSATDAVNHGVTTYFRGARFGYESAGGGLTTATPATFAAGLARAKRCAAHPDRCPGD